MDPALWENGQRLNEWDRERGEFTEAAQKAQKAKWRRLMANRPPRDALPRNLVARPGRPGPPLYHYGFPFTAQYAINYARRHHMTVDVAEDDLDVFRGHRVLDFADLDDAWLESDEDVKRFTICMSRMLMLKDVSRRCRFALGMGRPFSHDWDGILSLWTNSDFDERFDECRDHEEVIQVLEVAMNETEGHNSLKPQWWFDWNNNIGIFTSID